MPDLILASSSPYRRELLTRLRLPFESASPDIDESHRAGESAEELVRRLSASKAEALAGRYPQHLVIGSDQVAVLDGNILGKPHTPERAIQQLRDASGKSVTFLTGLALLNSASRRIQGACVPFTVHFRHLDESRIRRYVEAVPRFQPAVQPAAARPAVRPHPAEALHLQRRHPGSPRQSRRTAQPLPVLFKL